MNLPLKKIITASAGTGKTYRLSLEYITLLLKYSQFREFKPDQILVITFTRKATAEIRERIFRHLDTLGNKKEGWQELAVSLKRLHNKKAVIELENPLTEEETHLLATAYHHLMTHKDQLQVMTIDSYVHGIFRNLIRPVRGIDRFELDLKATEKRLPHLFNEMMTPKLLDRVKKLLSRRIKPSLDEFKRFFRSLIDNRWMFYLATARTVNAAPETLTFYSSHPELWKAKADKLKSNFIMTFGAIIHAFADYLQVEKNLVNSSEIVAQDYLNGSYLQLLTPLPERFIDLSADLETRLQDDYILTQLLALLEDNKYLWNGQKVRASKTFTDLLIWKNWHKQMQQDLSDYLMFHLFLPEQQEIMDIWKDVLAHYDKLIYRYKNFTYDDIAWFTFEALYSSHPPLFKAEQESIANEFYEFMCHRTRFMLIDEFQDTSILQFQILSPMIDELLSGAGSFPYGGIVVVGDEKQSIFGWRGGQRDLLLNLDNIFQSGLPAEKDALTESWRSSPALMNFINGIFGHNLLQEYVAASDGVWHYTDTAGKKEELENDTVAHFKLDNYSSRSADNKVDRAMRDFISEMVVPALPGDDEPSRAIAILARRNDELETIRALLAEHGITSEFQSSRSLLDHPIIRAMFFLLKFAVYGDWYDFLSFLRSDLVLLDGAALKQVINIISAYEQTETENKTISFIGIPQAQAALDLAGGIVVSDVYNNILTILETCRIQYKLPLQRDYVNVQRWLDLALEYERSYRVDLPELQGFLRYCEDNRDQEIMQQQDVESSTAVQLLTIHKSKGLEFDSVFVWWNLRSFSGREDNKLSAWVQYTDSSFHNLSEIALTLHYKKVLSGSGFNGIMREDEKRQQLEELNNLYVALTRAKNRLYLYAAYEKKEGWEAYWESLESKSKLTPPHYAVKSALDYMQNNAVRQADGSYLIGNNSHPSEQVVKTDAELPVKSRGAADLRNILPDRQKLNRNLLKRNNVKPGMNWKRDYLDDRSNLKGNIAHFYLAQLRYATREEIETAQVLTLRQFGNLMSRNDLIKLIERLEQILPSIKDLFSESYDLIFNEYPVYSEGGEYRIDRLMINTKRKIYRIIDYKTGDVFNEQQLSKYNFLAKQILLPCCYELENEPQYIEIVFE